jgi:hypothetical protein
VRSLPWQNYPIKKQNNNSSKQAKNRYWQNELDLLGIKPKQKKKELSEDEELENLADIIKQAAFQD